MNETQSRHARDVLRLEVGTSVDLFDDAGNAASGQIVSIDQAVTVSVTTVAAKQSREVEVTVASAVPKGNRADWMIEKLAEVGVSTFVPLATARSVVLPEGKGKSDRWQRIATEAAKQSQSAGVMTIEPLTSLKDALAKLNGEPSICLATEAGSIPITQALESSSSSHITLFIGPEGGWTPAELDAFASANVQAVRLTETVLRIETAAVVAAGVVKVLMGIGR